MTRRGFLYGIGFAVVNAAEAAVLLATFGIYSPAWAMSYAGWYMRLGMRRHPRLSDHIPSGGER